MIGFIIGTRPEIIKCAPVIHELARRDVPVAILHTGPHYTPSLAERVFKALSVPAPAVNLGVGSCDAATQIGRMVVGAAAALRALRPSVVVVQGDTNSVLAGALAALKESIPVAHLEAGMRSDDPTMPEEANRILTGHMAALHFCPTAVQAERLAREGIARGVHVVGNSIVDATLAFGGRAEDVSNVIERAALEGARYAVLTIHRPANVDDASVFNDLTRGLAAAARDRGLRLVFPVHPRTRHRIDGAAAERLGREPYVAIDPVGYMDMLKLIRHAELVITDSGGMQEEACVLQVPCVTLRTTTERPETIEVGANVLCPERDALALGAKFDEMLARPKGWTVPFGDGKTATRVADLLIASTRG